ncbi:MAG: sugar transferase [Candidatus Melainabacteria bacterium]|nr:sugar transferase [Candidatus Melainabacteria bacterium]
MLAKRLTDILLSAFALACFLPFAPLIALAIVLESRGPVLFTQKRFGRHGEFFQIYKFRTMKTGTPNLPTDQMLKMPSPITRVGAILRKTSLDEIPQLINVITGDMSLVGPRPALYNQTSLNAMRDEAGVLEYPPGITGWAQINGRDELPDEKKVELDKWYCDHWSYWLDWKIMFATVGAVLTRRGIVDGKKTDGKETDGNQKDGPKTKASEQNEGTYSQRR